MPAEQQLSGTIFVIIIAVCVQAFIILFIFVKRQIQRFALRNRRGPHTSIGHGGPKALRREIDRILDYVPYIKHEPLVEPLSPNSRDFRRLTIIHFQSLELEIARYSQNYIRPSSGNVRAHLLNCTNGPLLGVDTRIVHQVCDDYNNARYHYEEVTQAKFEEFLARLNGLKKVVMRNKMTKPHPSPLPPSHSVSPRKRRNSGHHRRKNTITVSAVDTELEDPKGIDLLIGGAGGGPHSSRKSISTAPLLQTSVISTPENNKSGTASTSGSTVAV